MSLSGSRGTLGDSHTHTQIRILKLAQLLKVAGKLSEARALFEELLRLRTAEKGEGHADVLAAAQELADVTAAEVAAAGAADVAPPAVAGRV